MYKIIEIFLKSLTMELKLAIFSLFLMIYFSNQNDYKFVKFEKCEGNENYVIVYKCEIVGPRHFTVRLKTVQIFNALMVI